MLMQVKNKNGRMHFGRSSTDGATVGYMPVWFALVYTIFAEMSHSLTACIRQNNIIYLFTTLWNVIHPHFIRRRKNVHKPGQFKFDPLAKAFW